MAQVRRVFDVQVPPPAVVSYLRDFTRTEEWDPGTVRCAQTTPGEVRLGTTWHNVSRFLGRETELDYELTRDDPDHLVFTGRNRTATSVDDIAVEASGAASRVTYRATVRFIGLARLADPVVQVLFRRIADDTVSRMRAVLEGPG